MSRIGYGKIGRSMPLSLGKCKNLGGDVEMAAVVKTLAERNPEHTFVLIGRNDGSVPADVGLPSNVENPWLEWGPRILHEKNRRGLTHANLSVDDQRAIGRLHDEVVLPTILGLDGVVLWAGQHGTTNMPLPSVRDASTLTKPYDFSAHYCSFLLHGVNMWRDADPLNREEVWLNADPRNYLKMRDLKWPLRHPVLAQRDYTHSMKHARYGDDGGFGVWHCPGREPTVDGVGPWNVDVAKNARADEVWRSTASVVYSRLEINGLVPGSPFGNLISYNPHWGRPGKFGLFINEARRYVSDATSRINALRNWVLPLEPDWIHGTWSDKSQQELGIQITPAPWDEYYPRLHSVHCTFTTPSSGSGWATTKPWEAFAAGTVCFFHPLYDDQDNILRDAPQELREWLRVKNPTELRTRVNYLNARTGQRDWEWLVRVQREHFNRAISKLTYARAVEARLFGAQREASRHYDNHLSA